MNLVAQEVLSPITRTVLRIRTSRASWAWAFLVLFLQLVPTLAGGNDAIAPWFHELGLSRAGILSGKIWQIFTYGLLHGSWIHAGVNAMFILILGSRLEFILGGKAMGWVLVAGVVGGGVAHLLVSAELLVGLSGGCIALLLLQGTLSPQSRMFPLPVSARNLGWGVLLTELGFALVNPELNLPGFSEMGRWMVFYGLGDWFEVGHACHFGGGVVGLLCGRWFLRQRVSLKMLQRQRETRERKG